MALKEGGVLLKVEHIHVDGMTAIIEMVSRSTAKSGRPFNNVYCWVAEFDDNKVITSVRAYMDTALVREVLLEQKQTQGVAGSI
jgi:ketosteroid isomerase-like protein